MSYEPRSRGIRPRRIATKKAAAKVRREDEEFKYAFKETVLVDPKEVSTRLLNALDHLGNQRFGMPPFSEHFHRWIIDVESALADFATSLPGALNENSNAEVTQLVSTIRSELNNRIIAEEDLSAKVGEILKQLSDCDRELAELESQHRIKAQEAKRDSERSMKKLRGEIDALDARRLKLLRQKPKFLERLFGGANMRVESSSRSLHSKQSDLLSRKESLKQQMDRLKSAYDEMRKPLISRQAKLREELAVLRSTSLDDALELRRLTCEEIRQAVSTALTQLSPQQSPPEGTE